MIGDAWAGLFGSIVKVVDKFVPDATKSQEISSAVLAAVAQANALQGQLTAAEVASATPFKSWWRPALAWVCVIGYALHFLIFPLYTAFTGRVFQSPLDVGEIMGMLMALLGLGGMRTFERIRGKA